MTRKSKRSNKTSIKRKNRGTRLEISGDNSHYFYATQRVAAKSRKLRRRSRMSLVDVAQQLRTQKPQLSELKRRFLNKNRTKRGGKINFWPFTKQKPVYNNSFNILPFIDAINKFRKNKDCNDKTFEDQIKVWIDKIIKQINEMLIEQADKTNINALELSGLDGEIKPSGPNFENTNIQANIVELITRIKDPLTKEKLRQQNDHAKTEYKYIKIGIENIQKQLEDILLASKCANSVDVNSKDEPIIKTQLDEIDKKLETELEKMLN